MELKDFKVGQTWATREGQYCQIEAITDDAFFPVRDSQGRTYTLEGQRYLAIETSLHDLVKLVQDVDEVAVSAAPTDLRQRLTDAFELAKREAHELFEQGRSARELLTELSEKARKREMDASVLHNMLLDLDKLSKPL